MQAFMGTLMPHAMKAFDAWRSGEPAPRLDTDAANAALARLPRTPDENLR
jgi:hypothetical protein